MLYDPFNLLTDVIEYTQNQVIEYSHIQMTEGDEVSIDTFATSIKETSYIQTGECSSTIIYECTEELTLLDFVIDFYFTIHSFYSFLEVSFTLGDQDIGDIWVDTTFANYLALFNLTEYNNGKHMVTNIRVNYVYDRD